MIEGLLDRSGGEENYESERGGKQMGLGKGGPR